MYNNTKTKTNKSKASVKTRRPLAKAVEIVIKIDAAAIPKGDSEEDVKKREKIIGEFYKQWSQLKRGNCKENCRYCKNSCRKVFNESLGEYIYVKGISVTDTVEHASKSYHSTLAVLHLDYILKSAVSKGKPVNTDPMCKNQNQFEKMQKMECKIIGKRVFLTVGIKRPGKTKVKEKVQYCITAVEA